MGQTNSSNVISPLQYNTEVKNVVMSEAYKFKLIEHDPLNILGNTYYYLLNQK
jgi:hypothetical protein